MQDQNEQQINRRTFVSSLGLIGVMAGLSPLSGFSNPQTELEEAGSIMKCKPYLQAAQQDRITVRWITNVNCYSWVEYGESQDNLHMKAHHVDEGLVQANNTVHDIAILNLQPGKIYYYRAVSKKIDRFIGGKIFYGETFEGKVYSFATTATDIDEVEFLVFNDIHDRPESFTQLMKYQGEGKMDFVLLNGDIFSSLRDEDQIVEHLLTPVCDLFATHTPLIYSRGNHEARGQFARQLPGYFNGREHKFYYSFQYGPMYAIVLDSGEDKEDDHPAYGGIIEFDAYRLKQKEWLEQEVKKEAFRKAKYKIVFTHIPPYYTPNKDAHGTASCGKNWVPVLNKAKIDLWISGHTHKYKIHQPIKDLHNFPIVIGGGPSDGQRAIINVKVNQHALNLKMTDDSGKTVGTLNL